MTVHEIQARDDDFDGVVSGRRLGLFLPRAAQEVGDLLHVREWQRYSEADYDQAEALAEAGEPELLHRITKARAEGKAGDWSGQELLCEVTEVVEPKPDGGVAAGYVYLALARRLVRHRHGEPWDVLLEREPERR